MLPGMMKAACDILEKRIHGDYSDFPARVRLKATFVNRDSIKDRYGRKYRNIKGACGIEGYQGSLFV